MWHKCGALILGSLLLASAGCEKAARVSGAGQPVQSAAFIEAGDVEQHAGSGGGAAGSPHRFIATRHKLEVIAPESNLPKAWESVITYCGTIECAVVSSNLVTKTRDATPSGSMSLRVSPG
jgi:hypothetical protein